MRPSPSSIPTNFNSLSPSPSSSVSSGGCFQSFKSPIPYLFGGLGLMLALIAVSLLELACSYRKQTSPSSSSNYSGCDNEERKLEASKKTSDSEPRILVIMAGQSNPTYLAKPLSSSSSSSSTETQETL